MLVRITKTMQAITPDQLLEEVMPSKRRRFKPDKNEPIIVDTLRKGGAEVFIIDWPFDLLIAFQGKLLLVEVKDGKNKLSRSQSKSLLKLWNKGCELAVLRSPEDAVALLNRIRKE